MAHRTFLDRAGHRWQVRVASKRDWRFEPVGENPGDSRQVRPPLYAEGDPYELSEQELRTILGNARPAHGPARPSPFKDDYEPPKKASPFFDDP